jgi:hypothetical protein
MIVVHFAKFSALYRRLVISLLAKRLEKPPFCHSYTSFGAWPRDHYMLLQRSTTGVHQALLRIPSKGPLLHHVVQVDHKVCHIYDTKDDAHPHSTEQDTEPIAFVISRQVIPYQTCGGTCCPGVSTPQIRS